MKNKRLIISISIFVCISIGIATALYQNKFDSKTLANQEFYNGLPVNTDEAMFMYDISTPEKAVGASDYVFIAKVNEVLRTEYKNSINVEVGLNKKIKISTPYTFYSINVLKNIKGELVTSEPIEFMQYGGLNEDGKSYTFIEEGSKLLEPNKYYIIMACAWGGDGGIIEASRINNIIELEENYNPTIKNSSALIEKYENAYKDEIVPIDNNGNNITKSMSKYDINYKSTIE